MRPCEHPCPRVSRGNKEGASAGMLEGQIKLDNRLRAVFQCADALGRKGEKQIKGEVME